MMPRPIVMWSVSLALSVALLCMAGLRASAARADAEREIARLNTITETQREIEGLRREVAGLLSTRSTVDASQADLSTRFSAALNSRGLPTSCIASLSPESTTDEGAGGSDSDITVERRRAAVTLQGLTLPQLGAMLSAWREREPAWTVTRIDLTPIVDAGVVGADRREASGASRHESSGDSSGNNSGRGGVAGGASVSGGGGGDLPLRAVLLLESVRIDANLHEGTSHRSIIDPPGVKRVTTPAIHDAGRKP